MPAGAEIVTDEDRRFMAAAIRLSRSHLGLTADNPSVGALIVRDDGSGPVIVGRGVTARGGRPHAELQALAQAGERARGATVYVTLEPCSHIGKSPPCADALVSSGISRVVVAVLDPDPRVAGRGVGILRRAGVEVATGCLETEATRAMAGFLKLRSSGRPFVTLKMAVSADGMIGRRGEGQVAITGEVARGVVQVMRTEHEAIMVGVGTALADDPQLTVRLEGLRDRSPLRVVIDPFARTPVSAKLFDRGGASRVLLLVSEKAPARAVRELQDRGATVQFIESDYRGRFEPSEILRALGVLGIKSVLLEGGSDTAARFLQGGLVDALALFSSDVVVGDAGIASPVASSRIPEGFVRIGGGVFGADRLDEFERSA